ncbi:hypothetical protein C2E23DRAFT_895846, partial [Lenzites betulinus]
LPLPRVSASSGAPLVLKVVLNRCDGSSKPFEITTLNGFDDFPLLGAVSDTTVGEALRKGSSGSIRVAGVTSVPFGPARHGPNAVTSHIGTPFRIESAVWTLRGQTLQLTWVNPNGRAQGLIPVAVAETVGFILSATADVDQFRQTTSATVTVVPEDTSGATADLYASRINSGAPSRPISRRRDFTGVA